MNTSTTKVRDYTYSDMLEVMPAKEAAAFIKLRDNGLRMDENKTNTLEEKQRLLEESKAALMELEGFMNSASDVFTEILNSPSECFSKELREQIAAAMAK